MFSGVTSGIDANGSYGSTRLKIRDACAGVHTGQQLGHLCISHQFAVDILGKLAEI